MQNNQDKFLSALSRGDFSPSILRQALQATGDTQKKLFEMAQAVRLANFPTNRAQVRSVIEISNVCRQKCKYCIIGANDQKVNFTLDVKSRRNRQTLWGGCTDANQKLLLNDT